MIPMIFAGILTCTSVMMISQGVEVYSYEKSDKSNALYFVYLCISGAINNISYACMSLITNSVALEIVWAITWFSMMLFMAAAIHVYAEYTGVSEKGSSLCGSIILYAGVILYLVDIFTGNIFVLDTAWGYCMKISSIFTQIVYEIICVIFIASVICMLFVYSKTCNRKRTRALLKYLAASAILVLLSGVVELFMMISDMPVFPCHTFSYFAMILLLGKAYLKHDALKIRIEDYREFLQATKTDPAAICDDEGKVVFINKCAEIIMIEEKELPIGKELTDYFEMRDADEEELHRAHQGAFIIPAIYKLSGKRCNLSIQNVFDTYGEVFTSIVTIYRLEYKQPLLGEAVEAVTDVTVDADSEDVLVALGAKILLVDDSLSGIALLESAMKPYQMHCTKAASGAEALNLVQANAYDMIFVNHVMTDMDGIETTRRIRELDGEYYRKVPIVLCTSNKIEDSLDDFLHARFSDYIYKPISGKQLSDVLTRWLWTRTAELKDKKPERGSLFDIEEISSTKVAEYIGENMTLYQKMLSTFLTDMEETLKDLNQVYQNSEMRKVEIYMHAVRNACNSIGAIDLSDMAGGMEQACKAANHEYVAANIEQFLRDMNQLLCHIEEYLKKRSNKA